MRSKSRSSFLVALALGWSIATVFAQDQAPAPSFKEGDTWQFNFARKGGITSSTELNDGLYELTFINGQVKSFSIDGNQKNEILSLPDSPSQGLLAQLGKSEGRENLKFPLAVGQKWTYQYQTKAPGARRASTISAEVNVVGVEQVTTAAGSFKAYKLVRTQSAGGQSNINTITYFYSPETRSIVKSSSLSEGRNPSTAVEIELIKFTPGN